MNAIDCTDTVAIRKGAVQIRNIQMQMSQSLYTHLWLQPVSLTLLSVTVFDGLLQAEFEREFSARPGCKEKQDSEILLLSVKMLQGK